MVNIRFSLLRLEYLNDKLLRQNPRIARKSLLNENCGEKTSKLLSEMHAVGACSKRVIISAAHYTSSLHFYCATVATLRNQKVIF